MVENVMRRKIQNHSALQRGKRRVASIWDDHLDTEVWIERKERYPYTLDSTAFTTIIQNKLLNLLEDKEKML